MDTASYADAPAGMIVNPNFQSPQGEAAWPAGGDPTDGNDYMTGIEAAEGSAFADQPLSRTAGPDLLTGLGGADVLYGYTRSSCER